jgi:hypothetical protein
MEANIKHWTQWIDGIEESGRLSGGHHLSTQGKVLYPKHTVSHGPFTSDKVSVAGYILVLAEDIDDALTIAEKCPILKGEGTSVEVRETAT